MSDYVNKTQEILNRLAQAQGKITTYYFGQLDGLKDAEELDLHERAERAFAAFDLSNKLLTQAMEQRNEQLERRERELKRHLFGAPGYLASNEQHQQFASALAQAATATDEQLASMADLAAKTGSSIVGKAVFAAAHERNLGQVMSTYLQNNPAERDYFEELSSMPPVEQREEQLRTAGTILSPPTTFQVKGTPSLELPTPTRQLG